MLAISTCTTGSTRTSCYTLQWGCGNHSNVEVQCDDDDDAQQATKGPHATRFNGDAATIAMLRYSVMMMMHNRQQKDLMLHASMGMQQP